MLHLWREIVPTLPQYSMRGSISNVQKPTTLDCLNLGEQRAPRELPMPEETLKSIWPLPRSPSCSSTAQMLPAQTQDLL